MTLLALPRTATAPGDSAPPANAAIRRFAVELPCLPSMAPAARVIVRNLLAGDPRDQDAEQLAGELVAGSVCYPPAEGLFELALDLEPGRLHIQVATGTLPPLHRRPAPSAALPGASARRPDPAPGARGQQRRARHRLRIERRRRPRAASRPAGPVAPRPPAPRPVHWALHAADDGGAAEICGMSIIHALADRCGFDRYPDRTVWWAQLTSKEDEGDG